MPRPDSRRGASGSDPGRGRRRKAPVYRPIHPALRPRNPATDDKPHRITAKAAVLPSLAISAKRGHRRGVPGELRCDHKTAEFPPRLRDTAAGYGGFTGITRRSERVLAGNGAKNAQKRGRLSGAGRRGLSPSPDGENGGKYPFTARFTSPCGPKIRLPAVNRTGLRRKPPFYPTS
jgi:hypothetical protein